MSQLVSLRVRVVWFPRLTSASECFLGEDCDFNDVAIRLNRQHQGFAAVLLAIVDHI